MNDIKCKCSHLKSVHHKVFFNQYSFCNDCQCERYLRCTRPDLSDKISLLVGSVLIVFGIIAIISVLYQFSDIPEETLSKPFYTFGEFIDVFIPLTIAFVLLGMLAVSHVFIFDYFSVKNRRDFNNQ